MAVFRKCCGCDTAAKSKELDEVTILDGVIEKAVPIEKTIEEPIVNWTEGVGIEPEHKNTATTTAAEATTKQRNNKGLVIDTSKALGANDAGVEGPRSAGSWATPHPCKRLSGGELPRWLSEEEDDECAEGEGGGAMEPPVTPIGRDELALRRHRFFSDLLTAAQGINEHRVRFDPMSPYIAGGAESDSKPVGLDSLLTRLESVTTRLEETAAQQSLLQGSLSRLSFVSAEGGCNRSSGSVTMSVSAYGDIVAGPLTSYLGLSARIGGDVAQQANLVGEAFQAQLAYLKMASSCSAPSQNDQIALLQPTSAKIQAVQELREKLRASPHFNHLSAISESIPALGWVTVSPAPSPYVKEMNDAGQFYTNRVLKDWKEKNKTHVEWAKAWVETLSELQKFVKAHHTTGLVWGGGGRPSMAAAPPPPPPPVAPPALPNMADVTLDDSHDRSALFAQINQGQGITRTLKKVSSDMQTHKNPELRSGSSPFKASTPVIAKTAGLGPPSKPPVFARDGKKWLVEHQKGNHGIVVEGAEMNNVVYMFGCIESTLTVRGKINSIFLDSCRKSAVVFDTLVSSVEFVNCQSVQMQVLGKVPTISIDKTDGCQMYLSADSLDVEIVSSKSSEMNVLLPRPNGEFTEFPIPEQFKTTVSPKGLTTVSVENKG